MWSLNRSFHFLFGICLILPVHICRFFYSRIFCRYYRCAAPVVFHFIIHVLQILSVRCTWVNSIANQLATKIKGAMHL